MTLLVVQVVQEILESPVDLVLLHLVALLEVLIHLHLVVQIGFAADPYGGHGGIGPDPFGGPAGFGPDPFGGPLGFGPDPFGGPIIGPDLFGGPQLAGYEDFSVWNLSNHFFL